VIWAQRAYDCAQLNYTIQKRTVLIISPLTYRQRSDVVYQRSCTRHFPTYATVLVLAHRTPRSTTRCGVSVRVVHAVRCFGTGGARGAVFRVTGISLHYNLRTLRCIS